ncbi:helix-turn-helix domain-containing protein [Pontimicrobium sp. SW4]|uniref:Helix-turn-helix domain-containing protein n=1 Tax=Pontimicrobium sp. SW4 TaxID=3153519 RepID=A0AAU7BPX3_9FLAO
MQNKVQFYREKNNLTQTQLAEKSGLSLRTIQRIENGNSLKGFTLEAIAKAFNIKPETLLKNELNLPEIKIINIATLSFFIIPFGNIILPAILTFKSKNKKTKSLGRDILSIQVIWTVVTCILLIISPFIQNWLQTNIPLLIFLLITLICINVFITIKNAISLTNKSELDIKLKINLL